ncbi:hypothetical protein [Streptomyces exfoliatus]|uniref:hypothetical protein n=1 Tax=Streptomyces exfoliatus TaxID=1905 RepID=UPI003F4CD50C
MGGSSLNFGNTLYVPPTAFFTDPQWGHIADWERELAPHYDQAQRVLGVRPNPTTTARDVHLKAAAQKMGVGHTFRTTPVAVFFGDGQDGDGSHTAKPGGEAADPYFGGHGPARRACIECGKCMTGCRHGAKNTLTENYLHLAKRGGAEVHPLTTATRITVLGEGYTVHTRRTDRGRSRATASRAARRVTYSASPCPLTSSAAARSATAPAPA